MFTNASISKTLNYALIGACAIFVVLGAPTIYEHILNIESLIVIAALTSLYALLVGLTETSVPEWIGFSRLPLVMAWILFGLSTAALAGLAGLIFVALWFRTAPQDNQALDWRELLPTLANSSTALLAMHVSYLVFAGAFPQLTVSGSYVSILSVIASVIVGGIVSLGLSIYMRTVTIDKIFRQSDDYFIPEALVIAIGLLLPSIYFQINLIAFLVIMGLVAVQVYRQAMTFNDVHDLQTRIEQMTTLSKVSTTITSHLSLAGTLESIHRELANFLDATTIYIALYNPERESFDYHYVVVDGKRIDDDAVTINTNLAAYVVRTKETLCEKREDIRRRFKNLYDVSTLTDQQYMIAPLMVSTKVIGVISVSHAEQATAFSDYDFNLFQAVVGQASLAIRNSILYDRTVRLADNLSIINQSLQDVMFNLDRQDALRAACQIAANVTRTHKAAIFLVDSDQVGMMRLEESIGFEDVAFAEYLPYDAPILSKGAHIVTNTDNSTDPAILKHAESGDFKAFVQIPLRSGDAIIGSLNVYHDSITYYETPELNLLEMLTNQITAALDNADLLQALELYAAEQAQLAHLSRVSAETLELEQIIQGVCQLLTQMLRVTRVAIGINQKERGTMRLESNDGTSFGLSSREVHLNEIPELAAITASNAGSRVRIYDQETLSISAGLKHYMQQQGDHTLALIPMRLEQDVIGLVVVGHISKRTFDENDLRLLEMATHQITIQIHNALVHLQTQKQLADRLEQLELIEDIAKQISEALTIDTILHNVLEAALQSTQAEYASIALLAEGSQGTYDMIWREVIEDQLVPNRQIYQFKGGTIGHVIETGKILMIPDNSQNKHYLLPTDSDTTFKSSIVLPMRTGNHTIGAVNVESKKPDYFTETHARFLQSLVGHAAISIDNSNMLVEREAQINNLTLLRELSLDALSMIEREEIFNALLSTSLILLQGDESALYHVDEFSHETTLIKAIRSDRGQIEPTTPDLPPSLLDAVVKKGTFQIIDDVESSKLVHTHVRASAARSKSMIILPMVRRQKIQEILFIGFDDQRQFTHQDLHMVDSLAVQVAGHLENADLSQEITTKSDRMRAILDSTRDGIILLDNNDVIQDVNSAAIYLTGVNLNLYLNKPLSVLAGITTFAEEATEVWQRLTMRYSVDPESIHNQEFAFPQSDETIHVKALVTNVIDDTQEIVGRLLVLRDITEEKVLQEFQTMMQSMVLHDLRGPLTSIVTSMYIAENILALSDGSDFKDLADALDKTFKVSLVSAEDMLRQVDTLRDLPMLSQMHVNPQLLPMYDIAVGAFDSLSANYLDSNIDVEIDMPANFNVFVDESLIHRVIINLMHNAFKFTPIDGKVLVRLVQGQDKPDYVRIQIADTGPGIPEDQRERIFGQYIQIEGQRPRAGGKGTGLGLNFCKLAAEAHGGTIWVEANGPLSGACFSFTIPLTEWRPNLPASDEVH